MNKPILITCLSFFLMMHYARAIDLNTFNDFEDGTTQGWQIGGAGGASGPTNIPHGGPTGANDNYLQNQSTGMGGVDGRFVFFNTTTAWTGNWTAAGITYITFMVNNTGATNLSLRIALDGGGGRWCSTVPLTVIAASGWMGVSIPVSAGSFAAAGGTDINLTLGNVTSMRVLSNTFVSFLGENIAAQAGFDNIAADNVALPIELTTFQGKTSKSGIVLNWSTASELNNEKYIVEHSTEGKNFESIGVIQGRGTTLAQQKYTFLHENASLGIHYYRLKQLDFDGKFTFSPIISVNFNKNNKTISPIYPNPSSTGWVFMDYTTDHEGTLQIATYDVVGRLISSETLPINEGDNKLQWYINATEKGVFFVKIYDGETLMLNKLYIKK